MKSYLAGLIVLALPSVVCALPANTGLIHYIDATDGRTGNTRLSTGEVFNAIPATSGIQGDNRWSNRPFTNGQSVFTANDFAPAEDAPGLMTTIGELQPGNRYEVFAYFWSDPNDWHLRSSITLTPPLPDEPSVTFSARGQPEATQATLVNAADFVIPPLSAEGNRLMYQAALGRARADLNGRIAVWIDDYAVGRTNVVRTWYDGVGYAAVIPEPSGGLLSSLGLLLLRRRKNKGRCGFGQRVP